MLGIAHRSLEQCYFFSWFIICFLTFCVSFSTNTLFVAFVHHSIVLVILTCRSYIFWILLLCYIPFTLYVFHCHVEFTVGLYHKVSVLLYHNLSVLLYHNLICSTVSQSICSTVSRSICSVDENYDCEQSFNHLLLCFMYISVWQYTWEQNCFLFLFCSINLSLPW